MLELGDGQRGGGSLVLARVAGCKHRRGCHHFTKPVPRRVASKELGRLHVRHFNSESWVEQEYSLVQVVHNGLKTVVRGFKAFTIGLKQGGHVLQ